MQSELDEYAAFYSEKHQGHKIEWSHALGTVSMRAHFAAGQKELSVSLYQAVVLLLFNDMAEIPFSDVKLCTGIGMSTSSNCMSTSYTVYISSPRVLLSSTIPPVHAEDAMLRCTLQSLACGKKRVLKKRPAGKDVDDADVFVFNDAFEDPRPKVHINSIQVKETVSSPFISSRCSSLERLSPFPPPLLARRVAAHTECG
jgi:cullin 4